MILPLIYRNQERLKLKAFRQLCHHGSLVTSRCLSILRSRCCFYQHSPLMRSGHTSAEPRFSWGCLILQYRNRVENSSLQLRTQDCAALCSSCRYRELISILIVTKQSIDGKVRTSTDDPSSSFLSQNTRFLWFGTFVSSLLSAEKAEHTTVATFCISCSNTFQAVCWERCMLIGQARPAAGLVENHLDAAALAHFTARATNSLGRYWSTEGCRMRLRRDFDLWNILLRLVGDREMLDIICCTRSCKNLRLQWWRSAGRSCG